MEYEDPKHTRSSLQRLDVHASPPKKKASLPNWGGCLFVGQLPFHLLTHHPAPWHALLQLLQHKPVPAADWQIGCFGFDGRSRANNVLGLFPWDNSKGSTARASWDAFFWVKNANGKLIFFSFRSPENTIKTSWSMLLFLAKYTCVEHG